MLNHICHCDTPHYEDDEHSESCTCSDCHLFRHDNFSHVGLCQFCDDDEQAELDAAEEAIYNEDEVA